MSSQRERERAVAWDPRSPATLLLPSVDSTVADAKDGFRMYTFLSHDGVGCNTFETSALMELLDARDAYLQSSVGDFNALRSLSKAYCSALCECVQSWEEDLETKSDKREESTAMEESLELLKLAYAVTHLSETFLLLPSNDSFMDYYEHTSNLPGAVTANTVRYLRLHHMAHPADFAEDSIIEEIHNSLDPDQLDGGTTYWKLLENYLVRGCLEDVWALLSRHSLLRRSLEETSEGLDDYHAATLAEYRDGFEALRNILLSAPLPGGRTDEFDSVFEQNEEDEDLVEDEYLEGIPSSSYKLWETNRSSRKSGDYPEDFQPQPANLMYQSWKQAIKDLSALQRLKRRIPQLQKVISILSGEFRDVEFDTWAEEFCSELLYKMPSLKLVDMHVRAKLIMEKFEIATKGDFEEVILSVMKGNAGRVIEVMHELGGGSGAALPAVMTSLLCDFLDDAKVMPNPSDKYSLRTELLLSASFSIRSSLATEGHHDLATRLSVRLLLPHVKIDGDVRVTANLVDVLEHHSPQTDAEANTLLSLCRSLVERKNVRVLDGCVSIALARYRYFLQDQRPGGAVHWLLAGMELESLVLCTGTKRTGQWHRSLSAGVCYRLLVTYCMETSRSMLKGLLGDQEGISLLYARAKEIIVAQEESHLSAFVPAVKVLEHVVIMAEAIAERKDESIVANSIVSCLENRTNDEDDGVVYCLARSSMHWDLLKLAKGILDRNFQRDSLQDKQLYTASFDVRGIQVLLERFTVMTASWDMEKQKSVSDDEIQQMRLALGDGLMRAFVAENVTKQTAFNRAPKVSVSGIYAADLGQCSREKQELVVERMLDF